jgi:hypothetical protein
MKGLGLIALFGAVGYLLSYGIFIPRELAFFQLLAAVGMMSGYPIGRISSAKRVGNSRTIVVILLAAVVCVATAVTYVIRVQMGQSYTYDIVILALLISVFFFSFALLMPFAGMVVDKSSN